MVKKNDTAGLDFEVLESMLKAAQAEEIQAERSGKRIAAKKARLEIARIYRLANNLRHAAN